MLFKRKPEKVFISACSRGHWSRIEDDDLHLKSTFMFISTLCNLPAGEASSADVVPILTIPVRKQSDAHGQFSIFVVFQQCKID
jgi:hypothetical protein